MDNLNEILAKISYRTYTTLGNEPKSVINIYESCEPDFDYSSLKKEIDALCEDQFFLHKLPCGRYIKSYRIDEVCARTLKVLETNQTSEKILKIIRKNPRILYDEFKRWLNAEHSSMMSAVIDEFWHQFLTFSYEYESWCKDNFGRFIHHIPTPTYEKSTLTAEDVLKDNIQFYKSYIKNNKLEEGILLYSLPLRIYVHEGKSFEEIKDIVFKLASSDLETSSPTRSVAESLVEEVEGKVIQDGYYVLKGYDQKYVCDFAEKLGEIINISDIKINEQSNRKFNQAESLDLHTDSPQVKYIIWYCIKQDKIAGESILLDTTEILEKLDSETKSILETTKINYPIYKRISVSDHPILSPSPENQIYYTSWLKKADYNENQLLALKKFENLVNELPKTSIKLKEGDALIINNKRMLHGRDTIPLDSQRYLYRIHVG